MNKLNLPKIEIDPVHIFWFFLFLLPFLNFLFLNFRPISLHDYTVIHLKMLAGSGFILTFIVSLIAFLYNFRREETGFFEMMRKVIPSYLPIIIIGAFILATILIINTSFHIDNTTDYIRTFLIFFISIGAGFLWTAALITLAIIIYLSKLPF